MYLWAVYSAFTYIKIIKKTKFWTIKMVQQVLLEEPHDKIMKLNLVAAKPEPTPPPHTYTHTLSRPPNVGLEGSSYGSRRGAAGLLLGHGRLVHGKTLFQ